MKHRILFIITKSEVGGAQKFVKEQIEICAENFEVYLCTNQEGWLSDSSNIFLRAELSWSSAPIFFLELSSQ